MCIIAMPELTGRKKQLKEKGVINRNKDKNKMKDQVEKHNWYTHTQRRRINAPQEPEANRERPRWPGTSVWSPPRVLQTYHIPWRQLHAHPSRMWTEAPDWALIAKGQEPQITRDCKQPTPPEAGHFSMIRKSPRTLGTKNHRHPPKRPEPPWTTKPMESGQQQETSTHSNRAASVK